MGARHASAAFLFLSLAAYPALMRTAKPRPVTPARPAPKPAKHASPSTPSERAVAQHWLKGMKLRDKIGQLIIITSYGEAPSSRSKAYKEFASLVRDLRVGGIIVVNRLVGGAVRNAEPHAMASFLNRMQRLAKVPLIVGADFERGASMRVADTAKFPHLMAYGAAGDLALTRELGASTAREARALGVHWVFAPDADVNNNPENPIINIRSFGEDPQKVAEHVKAFIEGAHSVPGMRVLTTAKHFPGHGDTAVDSHMGLASLTADRARMQSTELVPFRAAVDAGVDSIMTAHMAVPAYEAEQIPATVSRSILTGLLRDEIKFQGLVVTDAMDMQGLAKQFSSGEAAVRALEAGADVLLMPTDPEAVVRAVTAAVKQGRLTEKRITESVQRILAAKARVGLQRQKLVDVESIPDVLDDDLLAGSAQRAADRAVTLVKNDNNILPLRSTSKACMFIFAEGRYGQGGRRMMDEIRARSKQMPVILLDPQMPAPEVSGCEVNVIAAFVSVGAYRGNVALSGNYPQIVESMLKSGTPTVLVALGNPYLLKSFPSVSAYMATFSTAPTSEAAAVKALLGEIPVGGRLPVTIPGIAKIGDGISLAPQ